MDFTPDELDGHHTLFEQVNDAVFIMSLGGIHLRANQRAYNMLGYAPGELIGIGPKQLVTNLEYPHAMDMMERLLKGEQVPPYERTFLRKDGSEILVEINVQLVRNSAGQPLYYQSIVRDISERKRVEADLRRSETRFRMMLENLTTGVVVQDTQAYVLLHNRAALDLLGLTEEQLQGKTPIDPEWKSTHEDGSDFPLNCHPTHEVLKTGQPVHNVMMDVYRPQQRDHVWLLVNAEPEFSPDGKVQNVVCTFNDVTALRFAQVQVQEQVRLFSTVFHSSPIAIAISTIEDGTYIDVNEAFLKLIGYTREQVIGNSARNLGLWPNWEDRTSVLLQLLRTGRIHQIELSLRDSTGITHPILTSMEIIDINGQPHILALNQSIAERQYAQQQAAELEAKDRTVDALSKYLGHISHDLRNPLAVMVTSLYLLKHKVGATVPDSLSQFEVLNRQIENITRIVESMSEMFRLEYKLEGLDMRPVSFSLLIEGVVHKLQPIAQAKKQTLTLHNAEEALFVPGDAERLRRMVMNLIENAIQFTPEGGTITVKLRNTDAGVMLDVQDSGIGIAAAHLPHIFDHFYRIDSARSSTEGSAGLGLTIARKIVDAHGGSIAVESEPGVGTVFHVLLPLATMPETP